MSVMKVGSFRESDNEVIHVRWGLLSIGWVEGYESGSWRGDWGVAGVEGRSMLGCVLVRIDILVCGCVSLCWWVLIEVC